LEPPYADPHVRWCVGMINMQARLCYNQSRVSEKAVGGAIALSLG